RLERSGRQGSPARDVAVDVAGAHPEGIQVPVRPGEDGARVGDAREPTLPGPAVDRDLDVVAPNRAVVIRCPGDAARVTPPAPGGFRPARNLAASPRRSSGRAPSKPRAQIPTPRSPARFT